MPIFEAEGKKYNVQDAHIAKFAQKYPKATTIMERNGQKYKVKASDLDAFNAKYSEDSTEQAKVQTPNSLSDSLLNNSKAHPDSTIAQLREDTKKREEAAEKAYNESEVIYNEDKPYRPASVPQPTQAPAEGIVKAESDKLVQEQEEKRREETEAWLQNATPEELQTYNQLEKVKQQVSQLEYPTPSLLPAQREFEQKMDEINLAQRFGKITSMEADAKRKALEAGYRFASTPTDDMIRRTNARGVAELSKEIEEQKAKRYNELDAQYDLANPNWALSPTQNQSLIKGDQEYRTLMAAENALNDAQKLIDEVENLKSQEDYAEWRKTFNSLGRGAADKLFDVRTWDMGVKDMADATMLYKALDKADAGEELTDAERSLLDAKAYEMAVNAYFGSDVSRAYKLGGGLAQTIPFMFEMAINPVAGVGSAAQNKLVRYALKKLGKGFYQKKLKYNALKYGTRLLGDLAGGAGLALTSSLGSTSADAISRMNGQVKPQYDKWGEASFGGTESGVSAGKAIRQAVTAATLERFSEMLGYYPSRMLRGFNPMDKMLDKPKLKDVKEFFDKASHTTVARGMREFQNKTRWDGHLSEYFEEVANNVLNGIFVGDMKFDTSEQGIFNRENNIDTYLQCLIMAGGMSAIQTGYYPIHKYKQLNNYKKADSEGAEAFGDEWEGIKSSLSQINESGKQAWESLMEREDVTPKQKVVATRYFGANAALQAAEQADFKRVADENTSPEEVEISQSYDIGRSLYTPEEMNEAKRELEDAKAEVRRTHQLEENRDVDKFLDETPLESIRGSLELGGSMEEAEIKLRYLNAKAKYDGMLDAVSDKVNDEVEVANRMVDSLVNKDMGGIVNATITSAENEDGEAVTIVSGVIATDKDGNIDRDNTDSFLVYKDKDGSLKPISKDRLMSAQPMVDVEAYKEQLSNEIKEQRSTEEGAKIDGILPMNVGDTFYVMDERGLAHQAQVTGNFEDGSVAISLDNGNPQQMPREAVQAMANAFKDAEYQEKKAAQEEKERADMQQAEVQLQQEEDEKKQAEDNTQQTEQPQTATSRVPVGENGNLLYEQADSDTAWDALVEQAKGNEATAQKIADMGVKKAQKALDEVKQSSINEDMSIEEMLEAENAHNDAVAAAEANLNKWKEIASVPQRRAEKAQRVAEQETKAEAMQERIDKANEAISEEQKKAEQSNPYLGRSLTSQESKAVIALMENNAQLAPELELTPENWVAEFGEDGVVSTPIGDVKMGENQYLKLLQRKRSKYFGLIKPTLTDADIILEEYDPKDGAERDTKLLFIKTFTKEDGSRYIHFESVTVQKDTKEVSISSHEINATDLQKKMHNDNVVHLKDTFLDSELRLIEPQAEGSDIVPTPNASSDNKDTTNEPQKQEKSKENKSTKANKMLSEEEYINQEVAKAIPEGMTLEAFEETDEYMDAYNEAADGYSAYVKSLADSGELQQMFDSATIGEQIAIRKNVEATNYDIHDLIDTKKNAPAKKTKKTRGQELMENLGLVYTKEADSSPQMRADEGVQPAGKKLSRAMNMLRIPLRKRANMWSKKVGVPAVIVEDFSDVTSQKARANILEAESKDRRVTGWVEDGKVYLYMPNLRDIDEIDETYTHEVVGHKGMDAMLGKEKYRQFCLDVFDQVMTVADRKFYLKYEGVSDLKDETEKKAKAADEYIAHLSESTNLTKREAKLWDKIVDLFRKMLESLGFPQDISKLTIEDMIRKSYNNLLEKKISINELGGELSSEGILFSIKTNDTVVANREKQLKRSVRNGLLSNTEANDIREASQAMLEIAEVIAQAKNSDGSAQFPSFSQWNGMEVRLNANGKPLVSAIKSNGEYPMNIDFAKDCIKRDATNRVLNRLAQVAPDAFTSLTNEQLADINNIIKRHGLSVPCVGCFVEARRFRSPDYARSVVSVWNSLVDAVSSQNEDAILKELGNKVSYIKIINHLKNAPTDMVHLSEVDINAPEKYAALMIEHPQVPQLLQSTQGQNNAQLVVPEAVYYGDVLNLPADKSWDVDAAYSIGGVRLQSFSDFKAKLFFDYCQVLADLASKKLPAHTYTKVPSYAELFGLTGMKINLSLFFEGKGVDENGEYIYSQESIDPTFAYDIQSREGYTENVGTMAVGVSDEHILKMLADDRIRSISPYHKSGINPMVAKKIKATDFMDYTNEQNAVVAKSEKMAEETWAEYYQRITARKDGQVPNYGTKVVPEFNLYDDLLDTEDPIATAKNYVEYCQSNGIVPKFAHFVYNADGSFNEGYFKLLYDFAVTNKDGNYAPQKAVKWDKSSMPANTAEILTSALEVEEATIAKNQAQTDAVVRDIIDEVIKPDGKIQFSVKDNEATETIFATAKEKFGTTYDMREAGYILPDGSMLDFSGKHEIRGADTSFLNGQRSVDHRAIQDIAYDFDENETGVKTDLGDFLDRGAIRIDYNTGAINLNNAPTKAQKDRLKRLIERNGGDVYIDFGKGWDTEHYVEYESARASRVLGDIDRYYEEGIKPSSNIRFRTAPAFYSNAERTVENIKQEKATPEQWLKMIEKNGGLKAGEDKWLGLSDWLKASDKKILTKLEVLDYIKANEIQIEEVVYDSLEDTPRFKELRDEYKSLLVENDYNNERTFEAMVDKYGDDFDLAFEGWGNDLHINSYYGIESAETFLDARDINDTRIQYTTDGLNNKREIALVVPTIESWNESDEIHFGDAGNGRAIAWVRFGETTDAEGNRVLVIDEVQSKRHQEGREKGYNNPRVIEILNRLGTIESYMYSPQGMSGKMFSEREALKAELESLFEADNPVMKATAEQIDEKKSKRAALLKEKSEREDDERVEIIKLQNKQDEVRNVRDYDYYESEINEIQERIDQRNEELDLLASDITALNNEYSRYYNTELRNARIGVSPAPFEKNWAELAMKRMLRYAAENGFDKVAWTTGEQQAERYDIGGMVTRITSESYGVDGNGDATRLINIVLKGEKGDLRLEVDKDGVVIDGGTDYEGKHLSEVVGKENAVRLMTRDTEISGNNLRIGGEGMRAFYDQMIPSFMNKYGKKWGVKVGEVTMPNLEENNTMHSVDVTPAMRESVMQGQPMFRVTQDKARFDELQEEYDALDKNDEAALNAWRDKKVGVVRDYLEGVAQRFGMKPDIVVFNGADEAQMKEAYDRLVESFRKSGATPPTYEEFKEHSLKPNVGATYREGGDIITFNISTRDARNDKSWYGVALFHEDAHSIAQSLFRAYKLAEIWDEVKDSRNEIVKRIKKSRLYKDKSKEAKGGEFLAYSIQKLADKYKSAFQQYIKGEGDLTPADIVGELEYKGIVANFAIIDILKQIRNEYQAAGEQRNQDNFLGGVGNGGLHSADRGGNGSDRKTSTSADRGGRGRSVILDTVSQKGLRGVVSEDALVSFFKGVYNRVDNATRNEIYEYVKRNGDDFWKGTEQYLASLAENDTPLDGGVRDAFVQMLNNNGIEAEGLTDNDIRYMMWRTNQLQNNKGALSVAEDVVMKQKLGVDNAQQVSNVSMRVVDNRKSIKDKYNKKVKTNVDSKSKLLRDMAMTSYNFQEAMQDEMLALKIFQQLLEEEYGIKIPSYLNVYNAENSLSSRNKVEMDRFVETLYEDMMQEIDDLIKVGATEQEVRDYVVAKSGIERSIEFTVRDYINEQAEATLITEKEANEQREAVNEKLRNNEITPAEADYMRSQINQQRNTKKYDAKAIEGMRKLYEEKRDALRDRLNAGEISFDEWVDDSLALAESYTGKEVTDKAGLSGMANRMGLEDKDWLSNARKVANEFENKYNGKVDEFDVKINTRYLWDAINACNNATLKKLYDTGVISKDLYDKLQKQFMFYVPMSGFTEDVAEDVYSYIGNETGAFTPPIKKAGGRLSESDDPFAIIGNKMQSAILQGNRNAMKIKFLNLHRQFPTDLITEGRFWEVKQPDGSWQVEYPEIPSKDASAEDVKAAVDEFNERMKRLKESGDARIYRGKANVPYKITHKSHENQHQITVRLMGEPITMFVNGNPQLAKAINGKLKSTTTFWLYNVLAPMDRYMSSIVTSFNPDFVAPNVVRDVQQAFTMTLMDYGVKDAGKLAGLLPKALATTIKYANDIDIDPEIKTLYEEFLLNGGQTGYSHIDDVDKWKSRNKSRIDRLSGVAKVAQGAVDGFLFAKDGISTINGFFEDTTRFATYMLNRQNGKSIGDSIKAAKDISTNFNKKGSGATEGIWGAAAEFLRHWIMFFNPMVQGAYQHWDKMKKHTKKYALITAWNIGLGFTAALLNDMGSADDDEEMHYLNQNEYTRRSNLFIYIGDSYIKIPLAPVFREYYAIGDIIYTAIKGRITSWQATKAIFNTVRSIFNLEGQSSLTGKDGEKFRLGRFVAPDALAVIPDIAENANFMGSPIYRDAPWDELKPEYEKVYNGTWQLLIDISKGINNMMATDIEDETLSKHTGKIAAKNSSILINPAVWQYAIEQATGGIGSTIGNTINTVGAVFDPEREVEWNSVPIIRRFYTVPNERNRSRNLQNDYYEITQEQKRRRELYDFEKADTEGKADKILEQLQAEESAYLDRVKETKNDAFGRAELEADYHSKEKEEDRKNRLAEANRLREQFKAYQESADGQFYLKTEEIIKAVDKLRREIKKVEDDDLKKQKKAEMEAKQRELVELWKADERN